MTGVLVDILPNPTPTSKGGVQAFAAITNQFLTSISTTGIPVSAQPTFGNLSGNIAVSQMNSGTNASSTTFWRGDNTWATPAAGSSFTQFATIAALRAGATSEATVFIQGYSSVADGGEGWFTVNSGDTTSPDNGGTIIVDSAGHRWYRQVNGAKLNVKWFGAQGLATDDTAAIQACLTAAESNLITVGGSQIWPPGSPFSIFFPAGYYVVNSQLTFTFPSAATNVNLTIEGAGYDLSRIVWPGNGGLVINYLNEFSSVDICRIGFWAGAAGTGNPALTLNGPSNNPNSANSAPSIIDRCVFHGAGGYQGAAYWPYDVYVNYTSLINFTNCIFSSPNGVGNGILVTGSAQAPPVQFNVIGCYFTGGYINIEYGNYVQGFAVIDTNFDAAVYGINSGASETGLDQLTISSSQLNCSNCDIFIQTSVSNVILNGNLFYVTPNAYGAYFGESNLFAITGNLFVSTSSGGTGLAVAQSSAGGIVTGNQFYSLAIGAQLNAGTSGINVQSNMYVSTTTPVSNGGSNTIGGGSP